MSRVCAGVVCHNDASVTHHRVTPGRHIYLRLGLNTALQLPLHGTHLHTEGKVK